VPPKRRKQPERYAKRPTNFSGDILINNGLTYIQFIGYILVWIISNGGYMKTINSTAKKERKVNLISYSFDINNEHFLAHYVYGKKPRFELFHNNSLLGSSDEKGNKFEFTVNTETELLNIKIWIEYNVYSIYIGKLNGIGVEVNGNPVQHTLADPEVYVKNGCSGFYILLLILGLKSISTYYQTFKEYTSHIVSLISCSIYVLPLFLIILLIVRYKYWTKFALITGAIISILEFIDYILALPNSFMAGSGSNAIMLLFWLGIRVCVPCIFYTAYKWKKKLNIFETKI
jgi:hypothetical protein